MKKPLLPVAETETDPTRCAVLCLTNLQKKAMGPKAEAVIHPNIPTKELSWIDRMYQKLEDICVEVDRNPSLLIQV